MKLYFVSLGVGGLGGMERVFELIDSELTNMGHDVCWLFPDPSGWEPVFRKRRLII